MSVKVIPVKCSSVEVRANFQVSKIFPQNEIMALSYSGKSVF